MTQALDELKLKVLQAAALRGPFDPRALLKEVLSKEEYADKVRRARLLSLLHEHCTEERSSADGNVQWLLRASTRERALAEYEGTEPDVPTEITSALDGHGKFDPDAIKEMITTSEDESALSEITVTLERAGSKAPGHEYLMALRSRLNTLRQARQTDAMLGDKFIGRSDELREIESWIAAPQTKPPLRSLHIVGIPGIGKSFLLERIVQIARGQTDLILVRLDFDRSSLQVGEGGTVYDEVSRQIGDALPDSASLLRDLRMTHSERVTRMLHETADLTPRELLRAMIDAVASAGKRLVFLLDTLEVLQGQGATYVQTLMTELDRFVAPGKIGVSVISAGRAPIFTRKDPRDGGVLPLTKVEAALIQEMLRQENIPEDVWPAIVEEANGNPLRLRLLISAVKAAGEGNAAEAVEAARENHLDRGFVHRVIRSRLPDHLRRIANEGLILNELTAELLVDVLAPALGLGDLGGEASALIDELSLQRWLVSDEGSGRLTPIPDIRQEVMSHTYRENPDDTAAVNRAARDYFAERDPVLHLYHAAQLMRVGEAAPDIAPGLADRFPDRVLNELPVEAQDLIRHARGQRSATTDHIGDASETRGYHEAGLASPEERVQAKLVRLDQSSATGRARIVDGRGFAGRPDPRAVADLRAMLEQGERREATHILREGLPGEYAPASEVGVLILCHQWLTGHWSKARDLFALLPDSALPDLAKGNPQLEGRITLEIFAEFEFGKLVEWLHDTAFRDCAIKVMQSSTRIGLRGAALDFALIAANVTVEGQHEALGTLAPYLPGRKVDLAQERLRQANAIRADFELTLDADSTAEGGGHAVALAPVNPYYDRLFALVSEMQATGRGRLLADLPEFGNELLEAANLLVPGVTGVGAAIQKVGDRPLDMLALIRSVGLAADWAEGYSFFHPIPELPTLARALSRWQQTSAGFWAYDSAPPEGWSGQEGWSRLTDLRAQTLNARDSADRLLTLWAEPARAQSTKAPSILSRRLRKRFAKVAAISGLPGRLRFLSDSRIPAVFRPALAVLPEKDTLPSYFQ